MDKSDNPSWPVVVYMQDFILRITEKLLLHEADEIGKTKAA